MHPTPGLDPKSYDRTFSKQAHEGTKGFFGLKKPKASIVQQTITQKWLVLPVIETATHSTHQSLCVMQVLIASEK